MLEPAGICATRSVFGLIEQLHNELVILNGSELTNAGALYDSRAMNADKLGEVDFTL